MGDDDEFYMEMQQQELREARMYDYCGDFEDDDDEERGQHARYFLVDYENVNHYGLNGIPGLTEDDCVRIYYSEAADTMTLGMHRRIMACRADFQYIKVQTPIQNAVDCRILFDLEDLLRDAGGAAYYIVSKDTDYDKAIAVYRNRGLRVNRILEIAKSSEPLQGKAPAPAAKQPARPAAQPAKTVQPKKTERSKREAEVRVFFDRNLGDQVYKDHKEEIIQAILAGKTKTAVNSALTKLYPGDIVKKILKAIKPLIKDYPGR